MIGPGPLDGAAGPLPDRAGQRGSGRHARRPGGRPASWPCAATVALVVTQGSGAILADHDAQRLAREALFLLVFGSRPPIREALAGLLTRPGG